MTAERQIEQAIEAYLQSEGWSLETNHGDHQAEFVECVGPTALSVAINVSDLARCIARDLEAK